MASPPSDPLLTVRAAVVLTLSLIVGLVAGALGYLAHHEVASAVLIGGGAAAGGLVLFHALVA